jgi:hypothetical protein
MKKEISQKPFYKKRKEDKKIIIIQEEEKEFNIKIMQN